VPPIGDSKLAELLCQGTDVWNSQRPQGWLNLADLDLNDLDLRGADLSDAGMWGCNLQRTDLSDANLERADLSDASLCRARLIRTNVQGANFSGAWVYGAAIWDLRGIPKSEGNLSILPDGPEYFKADSGILHVPFGGLRLAQFMSAALSALTSVDADPLLSGMVDSFSSRVALLLGRFQDATQRLKTIASILKDQHSIAPLVFDFEAPKSRTLTETVTLWARLCSFIVADLTNPASVPHELASIVPLLPSVPVFPIITAGDTPYSMLADLCRYPWVHAPVSFSDEAQLESVVADIVSKTR
jgi:hypothetical protein